MSQVNLKEDFMILSVIFQKFVNNILKKNTAPIWRHLCLHHYITKRKNMLTRKEKENKDR